jgi:Tol biopolymer transport system component
MTPSDRSEIDVLLRDLHTGAERYSDRRVVRHGITPTWSPDSEWIAFSSDRDGDWDIYAFSTQTDELINLTEDWPSDEFHPSWGPG